MIRLVVGLPPSLNHTYSRAATGHVYKVQAAKDYQERVYYAAKATGQSIRPPVCITLCLIMGSRRRLDIDNALKLIIDGLATALEFDDADVTELHVYKYQSLGRGDNGCEITIEEVRP